jgi:transposase-like protein
MKAKKPVKVKGWDKVDDAVKKLVIADLANRQLKVVDVARKHNLVYETLCYWIREKKIPEIQ